MIQMIMKLLTNILKQKVIKAEFHKEANIWKKILKNGK